jgi:hypothetical protein
MPSTASCACFRNFVFHTRVTTRVPAASSADMVVVGVPLKSDVACSQVKADNSLNPGDLVHQSEVHDLRALQLANCHRTTAAVRIILA